MDITGLLTVDSNIGGAIYAIQSQISLNSTRNIVISNNTASLGGGIMLKVSELVIRSPILIKENRVELFGGGIYAYQSVINFISVSTERAKTPIIISNNFASQSGGGVYAVASSIKLTNCYVTISSNTALLSGGGLYLQENSNIYLLKQKPEVCKWESCVHDKIIPRILLEIAQNLAVYGGGIYVADNTTAGELQCQGTKKDASITPECFIQTIRLYRLIDRYKKKNIVNTLLLNNTAEKGAALYGGLLDRCSVSTLAEAHNDSEVNNGIQYINKTINFSSTSISLISSEPVQVIFCDKLKHTTISCRKGETIRVSISAIDQFGISVNATIHSLVVTESKVNRLKEGQAEQKVGNQCTELEYNVFSQDKSAEVHLYAHGPCTNLGISKQTFIVTFLPCTCPIGLQPSQAEIECECICDQKLKPYQITNCSQETGTIQVKTNIWIGVFNSTNGTGYIIHDCPFDYCVEKPVNISLNSFLERDKQCAFNRSGVLCGKCEHGLSHVLATSKCKECSNIYLLLLIPFALTGIALVGFILFFNITIATGSIHGLIFYSNLLPANYFTQPSVFTMFISWVNLDSEIETCLYNGMSSQVKVLLQLVFPTYLFLLIFLIIILSRYFNFFARLLSNRNPVAALCTLIFLSYSKIFKFIIAALQYTVLDIPGGIKQRVWLYDGNFLYFAPSHTHLFLAAALIIVVGGLLTLQLFFAQWFPRCSKWKLMKWTRNTKYTAFMDAYHAPFTRKHRYWVGLLLFALIVHNLIAIMSSDEFLPVLSMGCIAFGLILLKFLKNKVYKRLISDLIETMFLLNLVLLAFGTLYAEIGGKKQVVTTLADVSMGFSACLFLIIVCYHSYKYVYLQSKFHRRHKTQISKITKTIRGNLRRDLSRNKAEVTNQGGTLETQYTAMRSHNRREADLDVLAPITTDDYRPAPPPPSKANPQVTYTVVETIQ